MEEIKPNALLKFNHRHLVEVRKVYGYHDVNKLTQDLDQFEDWIKKQNHFIVKNFDRGYLERFIIFNKGSVEKAKKRLDRLCTMRSMMPEFLKNFDIRNEFRYALNCMHTCFLPTPTADNYRVAVTRWFGNDEKAELIHYYRYLLVMGEYALHNDYCLGYEIIVDTKDMEFGMLKKINPIIIQKALTILIEAMGQRLKHLHFLSGSTFLDTVINLFKQGITTKISKKILVHNKFDTIYKHITRESLPSDFGGDEKSIKELTEIQFKEFCSDEHIEFVKNNEKAITDESRRLIEKFNEEYMGMPGSFKTLCVD